MTVVLEAIRVYNSRPDGQNSCGPLDFALEKGQGGLLYGPNAQLLSDLLTVCSAWKEPVSGKILWWGRPAPRVHNSEARFAFFLKIGLVQAKSALLAQLPLIDNLALGYEYHHDLSRRQARKKAACYLEMFGLAEEAETYPPRLPLSKQRLAFYALTFSKEPELLLLENPRRDLEENFNKVWRLIKKRAAGDGLAYLMTASSASQRAFDDLAFQLYVEPHDHRPGRASKAAPPAGPGGKLL